MRQRDTTTKISCPATIDATASTIEGGRAYVADMARRLAPYFARSGSRQHAMASLQGLLREAERKHSGHVAEACGEPTPYGFQYWLSRADGAAAAVRDELRTYRMHIWGIPPACWSSTQPDFSNRAITRLASPGSIVARSGT
jgi:hypothetical protein